MANFSHFPLQQSIYQALTGNSGLMAQVTGIYDRPPQGTVFPYVTVGDFRGEDWSTKTTTGVAYECTLHIWSRQGGHKEAAKIMESVHTVLHKASFTVTGQTLVMMRFSSSDIVIENDGATYHGIMQFQVFLEAN